MRRKFYCPKLSSNCSADLGKRCISQLSRALAHLGPHSLSRLTCLGASARLDNIIGGGRPQQELIGRRHKRQGRTVGAFLGRHFGGLETRRLVFNDFQCDGQQAQVADAIRRCCRYLNCGQKRCADSAVDYTPVPMIPLAMTPGCALCHFIRRLSNGDAASSCLEDLARVELTCMATRIYSVWPTSKSRPTKEGG
jgi:hypothetical protein